MSYKINSDWLTPNRYSRPQRRISEIRAIVVHWVANPNTSAQANRNYFERRKKGNSGYGSAHEFIDLNGDVLRCLPYDEMAYHVGSNSYPDEAIEQLGSYPNATTYGIECTHIDWDGKMSDNTYSTLVERCADLCNKFNLNPLYDLWLHKKVVGWKDCHKWFVDNPSEWENFKEKVNQKINGYQEARVTFEGTGIKGYLINGKTMVKIRDLANLLNYQIGYDSDTKQVTFNNQVVEGKLIENRTYLHVREVVDICDLKIGWDQSSKTVTLRRGET